MAKLAMSVSLMITVGVKYHIETASLILKASLSLLQRDTNLRQSQVAQVEHMFFDVLSNSIMAERGNYKVSIRIDNSTGMDHKGKLYVADKSTDKIYELQLTDGRAKVLRIFKAHSAICGLASDGNFLYSCDSRNIYKYDSSMKITVVYKLKVSIAGITFSGPGEVLAVAKNKNEIYKFRLKHR